MTRGDGTVTASWDASIGAASNNSASKYHVTYSSDGKQSWSLAAFEHTTDSITMGGLDNGKTYVFAVRAGNALGWSGWRDSAASGPFVPPTIDYDADDDGLIDVSTVVRLDAMRHDLDGDGAVDSHELVIDAGDVSSYQAAYPDAMADMGCPDTGCIGYELSNDLDLSGWNWTPIIGNGGYNRGYDAIFEGNGLTISNLYLNAIDEGYLGLFEAIDYDGVVRNVVLSSANVTGGYYSGVLVGRNHGTVSNVTVSGTMTGDDYAGGLAGINHNGAITNSSSSVMVTGDKFLGGLVSSNMSGTITNSSSSGTVTGNKFVGGLAYQNRSSESIITGSSSSSNVIGERYVGGLIGINRATLINSSATGNVTAFEDYGALVGENEAPGTITNSQGTGTVTQVPGITTISANYAGLVSWQYKLASGVTFNHVKVRWLEKPASGSPNWSSANEHQISDASTSSYQITGLTFDKDYVVKLTFSLSKGSASPVIESDPVEFTHTDGKDFDADDDGLIDVSSIPQLSAMRYDSDGNGSVAAGDLSNYQTAYPDPMDNMGCPDSGCIGYEMTSHLVNQPNWAANHGL